MEIERKSGYPNFVWLLDSASAYIIYYYSYESYKYNNDIIKIYAITIF